MPSCRVQGGIGAFPASISGVIGIATIHDSQLHHQSQRASA
jgi:hypothetical protein